LKFKYFLIALTARTLESFVGKACNLESIGFTSEASSAKNRTLEELRDFWLPVVRAVTALLPAQLKGRDLSQMFSSEEELAPIAETMKGIIYVTRGNLSLGNFPDLITTG
jgi:hypothetical protein